LIQEAVGHEALVQAQAVKRNDRSVLGDGDIILGFPFWWLLRNVENEEQLQASWSYVNKLSSERSDWF